MTAAVSDRPAVRRRSRRFVVVLVTMFAGVAVLPALPWLAGTVGPVRHSYTAEVPAENKGTYLLTDDGVMQLYSWRIELNRFPEDAPVLDLGDVRSFVVVAKAVMVPEDYQLYRLADHQRVPWSSVTSSGDRYRQLRLQPPALGPGHYLLVVPTDSSFGGVTRHYFELR